MGILQLVRKEHLGEAAGVVLLIACIVAKLWRIIWKHLKLKPAQNRDLAFIADHYKQYSV